MRYNRLESSSESLSLEPRVMLMAANPSSPQEITDKGYITKPAQNTGARVQGKKSSTETFIIEEGTPKAAQDPRAEAQYGPSFKPGDDITFTGEFDVQSAKDTTIFQLLDFDNSSGDKSRPIGFIEADTFVNDNGVTRVRLYDRSQTQRGSKNDKPFYVGSPKFDFEVASDGVDATFSATGRDGNTRSSSVTLDRFAEPVSRNTLNLLNEGEEVEGIQPPNGYKVRYGLYHHDRKDVDLDTPGVQSGAASEARVVVKDAKLVQNS